MFTSIPTTQRQWRQTKRGSPKDCLELVEDAPVPKPKSGQVLVKIAYATPSPSSWKIIMGLMPGFYRRGAVPELEATGRIVDPNGSEFAVGDEVMCLIDIYKHLREGRGVLTEYGVFDADIVFPLPTGYNIENATGLPTNVGAAYQALHVVGKLQPGSRVFINGGTTACGMAAIQIAKLLGAEYVAVSCSAQSFGLVRDLGADKTIDYKASPLPAQLATLFSDEPFDILLDCVGSQRLFEACPGFLKADGMFITIAPLLDGEDTLLGQVQDIVGFISKFVRPVWLGGTPRKIAMSSASIERHARFLEPLKWAAEGKIKNLIDSIHESNREGVFAAYERGMSGRAKGKILINMEKF